MKYATSMLLVVGLWCAVTQASQAQERGGWWTWAFESVARDGRSVADAFDRVAGDRDGRGRGRTRTGRRGDTRVGGRGDTRTGRRGNDRDDDIYKRRRRGDDDIYERRRDGGIFGDRDHRGKRGKGPKFCRNGNGHPVHGRQWCRDKGFGIGGGIFGVTPRWERRRADDVIFRRRNGTLGDILGDVILGRLNDQRRRLGVVDRLVGHWARVSDRGARVLQIRAGNVPIAELSDLNNDGRVDVALVNRGR